MQGSKFDSLYLIMNEFSSRVRKINPGFKLQYSEALPLKDLFDLLEERRSIAASYHKNADELNQKANQLLFIQKRLLTRYKEKNSAPLNNLDILLESSITELINLTKESEKLQLLYKTNSQRVTISVKILLTLLSIRFPISEDGMKLLHKYLPSYVEPTVQKIGWVEIMDFHIFYLLKNVLAGKDDGSTAGYAPIENLSTFEQHFTLLIDKINKGLLANYKLEAAKE